MPVCLKLAGLYLRLALLGCITVGCIVAGCDSGGEQDARFQTVAGTYEAVSFTEFNFDGGCTYFSALQDSGFFRLTLDDAGATASGSYSSGTDNPRDLACAPLGMPEVLIRGTYSFAGPALKLNLSTSCEQRWHQSSWLIEDSTLFYAGFDVGRGPCMPSVTLKIPTEDE